MDEVTKNMVTAQLKSAKTAEAQALGKTRAEIDTFLAQIPTEGN